MRNLHWMQFLDLIELVAAKDEVVTDGFIEPATAIEGTAVDGRADPEVGGTAAIEIEGVVNFKSRDGLLAEGVGEGGEVSGVGVADGEVVLSVPEEEGAGAVDAF